MTRTNNIQQILSKKGMTAGQLASRLMMPVSRIKGYLENTSQPNVTTIEKIADILEVRVVEIINK